MVSWVESPGFMQVVSCNIILVPFNVQKCTSVCTHHFSFIHPSLVLIRNALTTWLWWVVHCKMSVRCLFRLLWSIPATYTGLGLLDCKVEKSVWKTQHEGAWKKLKAELPYYLAILLNAPYSLSFPTASVSTVSLLDLPAPLFPACPTSVHLL